MRKRPLDFPRLSLAALGSSDFLRNGLAGAYRYSMASLFVGAPLPSAVAAQVFAGIIPPMQAYAPM